MSKGKFREKSIEEHLHEIMNVLEVIESNMVIELACKYPNQEFDVDFFNRVAKIQAARYAAMYNVDVSICMFQYDEKLEKTLKNKLAQEK